jgi:hypothetical protein
MTAAVETRMGKRKWLEVLSSLQRDIAYAKRVGWQRGRARVMQGVATLVWVVQNTGRARAPRFPRGPHKLTVLAEWSKG